MLCGLLDLYEEHLTRRLHRCLAQARGARERALCGDNMAGYGWWLHLNIIAGRALRGMRFRGLRGAELEEAVRYLEAG